MYLRKVSINNIRSISEMTWQIPEGEEAGWHVVIGDNGSGKSTFLRSIALGLVGPKGADALRQDWSTWLSQNTESGSIKIKLIGHGESDKWEMPDTPNAPLWKDSQKGKSAPVEINPEILKQGQTVICNFGTLLDINDPEMRLWIEENVGWFSAGYGPFRRFTGGDQDSQQIYQSNPRLAPHLSLFGENVALTETLAWLQQLQFKKLEKQKEGALLNDIRRFINQQGFLPHETKLHKISSDGVTFVDGNKVEVGVEILSDGYRSVLSMTFDLIHQMTRAYEPNQIFDRNNPGKIVAPGVVLIDEVDAHLHPTWQRRIGLWFREHFPNIQFIVTTHSPLICQAADVGTVWRLPKPGSGEKAMQVTGTDLERLLYGNVLDAYSTEMFGAEVTRSEMSKQMLERLAELNLKEVNIGLTKKERAQQEQLRATMPTRAHKLPATQRANGKRKSGGQR